MKNLHAFYAKANFSEKLNSFVLRGINHTSRASARIGKRTNGTSINRGNSRAVAWTTGNKVPFHPATVIESWERARIMFHQSVGMANKNKRTMTLKYPNTKLPLPGFSHVPINSDK
ncbi:hypothetical protein WA026_005710 [Henosepilachna vigintioctopunctata]|uniref:Uncharacterized protein n=1 Tax=Henosepilachna vigintioctopunctata TaxID=420089 RepID=A0AAW1U2X0_9CUCU